MQLIRNSLIFLMLTVGAFAQVDDNYGMNPVLTRASDTAEESVISNMPPIVTQDSLGICYAFAAAKLIDRQTCVDQDIKDCKNMPDRLRVAPLDTAKFAKAPENKTSSERSNYGGIEESGILDATLRNALYAGSQLATEECAPFNQVVANNSDPEKRKQIEENFWARLKALHKKAKQSDPSCAECQLETATAVDRLRQDFSLKASNQEILKAFAQDTHAKFLEEMLIPQKCSEFMELAEIDPNYEVKAFPKEEIPHKTEAEFTAGYDQMIGQIKSVLKNQIPIGLSFCGQQGKLTYKSVKECNPNPGETSSVAGSSHAVVISGYRRVCKNKNKKDPGCYDALKVENSWGQEWQDKHNDGWVDAKELMKRTFFAKSSLTWLEKTK